MKTQNTTPAIENEFVSLEDMFKGVEKDVQNLSNKGLKKYHETNEVFLDRLKKCQSNTFGSFALVKPFDVYFFTTISTASRLDVIETVIHSAKNKMKEQSDFDASGRPEDHPNYYFHVSEKLIEAIKRIQKITEKQIVKEFIQQTKY